MDYPWNSPGQNTGVGSLSLLQGIFPTQGSNPSLPHCRQILYQLRHKGSPRTLEWVAYPFSRGSSRPTNIEPGSPALQADSLPTELSTEEETEAQKDYVTFPSSLVAELKWQLPVLFFIRKPWLLLISFFKSRLHGNLKQHRLTRLRELVKRVCTNVVSDCTLVEMRLLHPKEEMRPFEVQSSWIDNLLHSMIKTTAYKSPSP